MDDIIIATHGLSSIDDRKNLELAFPNVAFPSYKLKNNRFRKRLNTALSRWSFVRNPSSNDGVYKLRRFTRFKVFQISNNGATFSYYFMKNREITVRYNCGKQERLPFCHPISSIHAAALNTEERGRMVATLNNMSNIN